MFEKLLAPSQFSIISNNRIIPLFGQNCVTSQLLYYCLHLYIHLFIFYLNQEDYLVPIRGKSHESIESHGVIYSVQLLSSRYTLSLKSLSLLSSVYYKTTQTTGVVGVGVAGACPP